MFRTHTFLLFCLAGLSFASIGVAAEPTGAKLTYRRVFKSSSPELIEIVLREDSDAATYEIRQLDEEPGASPFEVSAPLRAKMFDLAAQLNYFRGLDLDVQERPALHGRDRAGRHEHELVALDERYLALDDVAGLELVDELRQEQARAGLAAGASHSLGAGCSSLHLASGLPLLPPW